MPRKLKVYQTSQGFYDLALAAHLDEGGARSLGSEQQSFPSAFAKERTMTRVIAQERLRRQGQPGP